MNTMMKSALETEETVPYLPLGCSAIIIAVPLMAGGALGSIKDGSLSADRITGFVIGMILLMAAYVALSLDFKKT
jgi:hypothetical protein